MPLVKTDLKSDLQAAFSSPGATRAACAALWATAVGDYAAGVIPASAGVPAATAALEPAIAAAFNHVVASETAEALETAFATFAAAVGTGMAPAFVATPPTDAVGFADLFEPPFPISHAAAAQDFADAVDAWMTSGTATPAAGGDDVSWG